jgi:hypothetical protein
MKIAKKIVRFFDKLEDVLRARLSHHPILYAFIGGIGVVLFWKGVWETAEQFPELFGVSSILLGLFLTLPTGLFVSFFIGDNIILSGYKREKKLTERTENELHAEKDAVQELLVRMARLEAGIEEIGKHILPQEKL